MLKVQKRKIRPYLQGPGPGGAIISQKWGARLDETLVWDTAADPADPADPPDPT